jgi:hypothetical protein
LQKYLKKIIEVLLCSMFANMKELRQCIAIDSGLPYLFHTWIKKVNSEGEMLIAVVEDVHGIMHEVKSTNLKFIGFQEISTDKIDITYEVKKFTLHTPPPTASH